MPILFNATTGEPYIPLAAPHTGIILTPDRYNDPADESAMVTILNDERVYRWLFGTPVPYMPENAKFWIEQRSAETGQLVSAIKREEQGGVKGYLDGCPFTCIREMTKAVDGEAQDTSKAVFIGSFDVTPYTFCELGLGSDEQRDAVQRNRALPVGSESMIWGCGGMNAVFSGSCW